MNNAPADTIESSAVDTIVDRLEDAADRVLDLAEEHLRFGDALDWLDQRIRQRAARKMYKRFAAARGMARTQVRREPSHACALRPRLFLTWAAASEAMAVTHDAAWPGRGIGPDGFTHAEALHNEARLLRTLAEVERIRAEWEPGQGVRDRVTEDEEIEAAAASLLDELRLPCTPASVTRDQLDELRVRLRPLLGGAVGILPTLA